MHTRRSKGSRRSRASRGAERRWIVQSQPGHRTLSGHAKRLDAEMVAARKSKSGSHVEVRDRHATIAGVSPSASGPCYEWVSIYRSGWLKDSNRRGSYVPPEQRSHLDSLK